MHWNHRYLPHWKDSVTSKYPQGRHVPPDDIGASFYPELGCYSSRDPAVIATHMTQLRVAGVGVIVVSWYPAGLADEEGPPPDPVIPVLLDTALAHDIKITLHIEAVDTLTRVRCWLSVSLGKRH
jgi:glycoprotein endo-alpha-1,2-mannosidase